MHIGKELLSVVIGNYSSDQDDHQVSQYYMIFYILEIVVKLHDLQ